jgi:peptidoglycan/xylan/chitin deacetylase (PgdA/CDA1 family)
MERTSRLTARAVSMPQQLLLVNYHYVREPHAHPYPGIHPISPAAFAQQLKELAAKFHIATPQEVEACLLHGRDLPRDSVLLTFDDGLVDHAQIAQEILDPMGVKAVFFVCSRPLVEERAVAVHKIHWLRATTEPSRFATELLAALPLQWRERNLSDGERQSAARTYIYDKPADGEIKYLLNFILPEEIVDQVTSAMLARAGMGEAEFCRRSYMDAQALRKLVAAGHRVEAHTHDHRAVTRLGANEDASIALNVRTLEQATGRRPSWISYPYGRDWALPKDPAAFCRRHDFKIGVALEGTFVTPEHAPYALDRINTNEVERVVQEHHGATG